MYDKSHKNPMNYNRQKICSRVRRLETLADTEKRGSRNQLFADFSFLYQKEDLESGSF